MMQRTIHPRTSLGTVALVTRDAERLLQFYQQQLGMQLQHQETNTLYLGAGGRDLLILIEELDATMPAVRSTGLYHLAILVPSRLELARALRRLVQSGYPMQGFADHGVSEAIYLADPDGNGIEIYRDYQYEEWPRQADGSLLMVTDPLDVQGVLDELRREVVQSVNGLHADTVIGHIHLRVAQMEASRAFYCDLLGFDLIQLYGPSAGFVSAGGYHHHIGFNIWNSAGAPPPAPGSAGLRYFSICLPDAAELERLVENLQQGGYEPQIMDGSVLVNDPSQNGVLLTVV